MAGANAGEPPVDTDYRRQSPSFRLSYTRSAPARPLPKAGSRRTCAINLLHQRCCRCRRCRRRSTTTISSGGGARPRAPSTSSRLPLPPFAALRYVRIESAKTFTPSSTTSPTRTSRAPVSATKPIRERRNRDSVVTRPNSKLCKKRQSITTKTGNCSRKGSINKCTYYRSTQMAVESLDEGLDYC